MQMKNATCKFQESCMRKSWGHSVDFHSDISNSIDNSSFVTLTQALAPQYSIATNVSTSEKTSLGLPTPNHNNFLHLIAGETSETIVCTLMTDDHIMRLNKASSHASKIIFELYVPEFLKK